MSRKLLAVMLLPPTIGVLFAIPASMMLGADQWFFFAIAFGLCVPAGLVAVLIKEYLIRTSPYGRVAAVAVGPAIRLVACFGGGVALFLLLKPENRNDKLAFWMWILVAYLAALVVETAIFAKPPAK